MIFEYIFVLGGDIATWCQILGGNVTGEFTKGGNVNADSKNWEVIWRLMGENKKADYGRKYEYAPLNYCTFLQYAKLVMVYYSKIDRGKKWGAQMCDKKEVFCHENSESEIRCVGSCLQKNMSTKPWAKKIRWFYFTSFTSWLIIPGFFALTAASCTSDL